MQPDPAGLEEVLGGRGRVMLSAAAESMGYAVRELRDAFGRWVNVETMGPDLGVIRSDRPSVAEVAQTCDRGDVAFVRHLSAEVVRLPRSGTGTADEVAEAALGALSGLHVPARLAVQVWTSGSPGLPYRAGEIAGRLTERLADRDVVVAGAGERVVLSCCLHPRGASIGLNLAATSLCDWPGGRVRLSRGTDRVSRSEFKLEELFQLFPVDLPSSGAALDLGASPGGWTRVLRERGLEVWAVDPGDLHPVLTRDRLVHHVRSTSGEFLRSTSRSFDVVVNDMRMPPELSARSMLEAARRMRPGGLAVLTLKTGSDQPVTTIRRCVRLLGDAYRVEHVRQLHHNRQEVTVLARRK